MPLSVLEAFASGMPVVSTNVGGIPSILRNAVDGLLVPDNDDEALATGVLKLLSDPMFARGLAGSAHRTLSAYEWPVVREGWLRAYWRVAARHREVAAQSVPAAPSNPA
jgi:glycosyltransferase involved in cell wall biosynthesis